MKDKRSMDIADTAPNPVDVHVGGRVRTRRKFMALSQTDLAVSIGLTFQQVQKYERGANRISASKLYDIARTLKVPVDYFFQGYHDGEAIEGSAGDDTQITQGLLMTPEGIELAEAFPRIKSERQRQKVLDLVRSLGNGDADEA